MKKAILFSMDALIALLILISTLTGVFVIYNQINDEVFKNRDLYDQGYDVLEIMKSKGILSNALEFDADRQEINSFLWDFLPSNVCSHLKLKDKYKFTYLENLKPGCRPEYGEKRVIVTLPFIHDNQIYNAEMILWYK